MPEADDRLLLEVLGLAQARGLLGPAPVSEHVRHAEGFLLAAESEGPPSTWDGPAIDLGSGGGIPGLVLAVLRPASRWILLDSRERSWRFLLDAIERLALGARVEVVRERAEVVGRSGLRGCSPLVVARAFGPPAVTAECAAPLLRRGGQLVVSNPPTIDVATAWPSSALSSLGMGQARVGRGAGSSFTVVVQASDCPERFPRRSGVPAKRPLF